MHLPISVQACLDETRQLGRRLVESEGRLRADVRRVENEMGNIRRRLEGL